jgi:hypothetical protein
LTFQPNSPDAKDTGSRRTQFGVPRSELTSASGSIPKHPPQDCYQKAQPHLYFTQTRWSITLKPYNFSNFGRPRRKSPLRTFQVLSQLYRAHPQNPYLGPKCQHVLLCYSRPSHSPELLILTVETLVVRILSNDRLYIRPHVWWSDSRTERTVIPSPLSVTPNVSGCGVRGLGSLFLPCSGCKAKHVCLPTTCRVKTHPPDVRGTDVYRSFHRFCSLLYGALGCALRTIRDMPVG